MEAALRLALRAVQRGYTLWCPLQDLKDALSVLCMHCFALADTPLAPFLSVCVLRCILLCCFHG